MKKLFAVVCLVFFVGAFANAQTTSTEPTKEKTEKVVKCTEAEKAQCEKDAKKEGAKCETTDAKSSAGCSSTAKAGSCCKSGSASAGSCCSKGKAEGKAEAAPEENMKQSKKVKTANAVETPKK